MAKIPGYRKFVAVEQQEGETRTRELCFTALAHVDWSTEQSE